MVLGMHRSGTSALMGVLHLLGVQLGTRLIPAHAEINPKGFWEHTDIVRLNDRLLGILGKCWHDVSQFPDQWWRQDNIKVVAKEIVEVLRRDFNGVRLWGIKDPRICRLIPFWLDIFAELGISPLFVIIFRHPMDVADSLARREGFGNEVWTLLWLTYVLDSLAGTKGYPRVFIEYDELLKDSRGVLSRIRSQLDFDWPKPLETVAKEIDEFLDLRLQHYRHPINEGRESSTLLDWSSAVYHVLQEASEIPTPALENRIAGVQRQLSKVMGVLGPTLGEQTHNLEELKANFTETASQLRQVTTDFEKISAGFNEAMAQLKQVTTDFEKINAGFSQALKILAARDSELATLKAELARLRSEHRDGGSFV